ncbi:MAG: flagellar protein FliT [Congregibacter sp.]
MLNQTASNAAGSYQRLAGVLNLTRDMIQMAGNGDWDGVAKMERVRRDDLQQCFLDPFDADQGELVSEALAVMLHLNEELMALLAGARDTVLAQGATQARTRSAVNQYQDVKSGVGR